MQGVSETNNGGIDRGKSGFTAAWTLVVSAALVESIAEAEKTLSDKRCGAPEPPAV